MKIFAENIVILILKKMPFLQTNTPTVTLSQENNHNFNFCPLMIYAVDNYEQL